MPPPAPRTAATLGACGPPNGSKDGAAVDPQHLAGSGPATDRQGNTSKAPGPTGNFVSKREQVAKQAKDVVQRVVDAFALRIETHVGSRTKVPKREAVGLITFAAFRQIWADLGSTDALHSLCGPAWSEEDRCRNVQALFAACIYNLSEAVHGVEAREDRAAGGGTSSSSAPGPAHAVQRDAGARIGADEFATPALRVLSRQIAGAYACYASYALQPVRPPVRIYLPLPSAQDLRTILLACKALGLADLRAIVAALRSADAFVCGVFTAELGRVRTGHNAKTAALGRRLFSDRQASEMRHAQRLAEGGLSDLLASGCLAPDALFRYNDALRRLTRQENSALGLESVGEVVVQMHKQSVQAAECVAWGAPGGGGGPSTESHRAKRARAPFAKPEKKQPRKRELFGRGCKGTAHRQRADKGSGGKGGRRGEGGGGGGGHGPTNGSHPLARATSAQLKRLRDADIADTKDRLEGVGARMKKRVLDADRAKWNKRIEHREEIERKQGKEGGEGKGKGKGGEGEGKGGGGANGQGGPPIGAAADSAGVGRGGGSKGRGRGRGPKGRGARGGGGGGIGAVVRAISLSRAVPPAAAAPPEEDEDYDGAVGDDHDDLAAELEAELEGP